MKRILPQLCLILFIAGCAKADDPETLRLRLKQDLTTLDPAFIVDVPFRAVLELIKAMGS